MEEKEKEIYIPEEWARVICGGLGWQSSEGDLEYEKYDNAQPLLDWIKAHYPSVVEEYSYLF